MALTDPLSRRLDLLLLETFGYTNLTPLGLLYVAAYAQSRGYTAGVQVLQSQVVNGPAGAFSRPFLHTLLERHRPRVVGLSVYAESQAAVARCCRRIRDYSDAKILLGGPQATADPFGVMERTGADAVILGDGEAKTVEVMQAWDQGRAPADLTSILFLHEGQILHDGLSPAAADLESLPFPDYSLLLNPDAGVRTMVTGRGCPFRCSFCFEGGSARHRIRRLEAVLDELRGLLTGGNVNMFVFLDDTFTLNKRRLREICRVLREHYQGPWFCEGRVEVLHRDPEIIEILGRAGLTRIQLGLESGSQKVLDAYRKNCTPEQIRSVFRRCAEVGISSVIGNFIVGGAMEDNETFRETLTMARDLIDLCPGTVELLSCFLYPYKGTAVEQRPWEFDLEFVPDIDYFNSISRIVPFNRTRRLSRGEISQLRMGLDAYIRAQMLSWVDGLPAAMIEKHFLLARDHHISSEWYNTFVQCPALAMYARYLIDFSRRAWSEIRGRADWMDWCPVRMGNDNGRVKGDGLVVGVRHRQEIRLAGLNRWLFQLSVGKLSLAEMLPILRAKPELEALDGQALLRALRRSNEQLAEDLVLVYGEL
jgi:anaerobic magnesium-protoporphyrin IX monomethyl ester cyclase